MIIPDTAPKISNDKKSLNSRHILPPSFLFRRKEAKENHLRNSFLSALLLLSLTCYTKRTVHIRTVRFSFRAGYAGKRFPPKESLPRSVFCFFSSRKEIVPLSFLSRKKKRSACAGSAAPQTDGRRHILRCRRSEYRSGYASLLRLVSARVRRACAPAFPCKLTTQKKVDFRRVFFAAPAVFANLQHKTDGSHTNRPFFPSKQDVRENVFS